jgi:hypothetical protein
LRRGEGSRSCFWWWWWWWTSGGGARRQRERRLAWSRRTGRRVADGWGPRGRVGVGVDLGAGAARGGVSVRGPRALLASPTLSSSSPSSRL